MKEVRLGEVVALNWTSVRGRIELELGNKRPKRVVEQGKL